MPNRNSITNKKIKQHYLYVGWIMAFVIIAIIVRAVRTSLVERDRWIDVGKRYVSFKDTIPATRGSIYSSDDRLMAGNETSYKLYMDFWADGLKENVLNANIKPLSIELNKMFPEKSADQYEKDIRNGWDMRKREAARLAAKDTVPRRSMSYPLAIRQVNYTELMEIKNMPFFNLGSNRSGLCEKKFTRRIKPYGIWASRTIGDIYNGFDSVGGKYGLEKEYDTLLSGKPGIITQRWVEGGFKAVPETDPVSGKDIITTIDVNFQEIVENALREKLDELNAESGTAVVMEVKTGEIKAIANLGKSANGAWSESLNYALSDMSEPGSTFKVASMMVALEDGLVHPTDPVDVGNGKFKYGGAELLDHNADRGGYHQITAEKAIWFSSNIGVAKLILKAYEKNPKKYVDGLYRVGINKDLKIGISEYMKARIRYPNDSTWYKTTLPWMSFGYETQIPPINTLTYFNAIANNGKMVKPIFVKEIRDDKGSEKLKTEVLNEHICSDKTLKIIHSMLDSVVNHPQGTGKPARSTIVRIAGKTGTAQLSKGKAGYKSGGTTYQVSFCGYFPADDPIYSCIVVIRRPLNGSASGGLMSGKVFKQIAEAIYGRENAIKPVNLDDESRLVEVPKVKSGLSDQSKYVLKKLNIRYTDSLKGNWATVKSTNDRILLKEEQIPDKTVPNVIGMGAKDAVFALESTGLQVNLLGRGEVFAQSLDAGTAISRGQTITVQLR